MSKVVFGNLHPTPFALHILVGNISYDVSEEQLREIFGQVGRVVSFRLVMDRETGRSKGYGFCEYEDVETASSAVRNLNNYDTGGRNLRVDYSDNDTVKSAPSTSMDDRRQPTSAPMQQNQSATDAITGIIGSLNANQLFEIMSQMKALVQTSPEQARAVLLQAPQISYALFQALIIMKVITPATIQQVLQSSAQTNPVYQPQPQVQQYAPQPQQQGMVDINSIPVDQRAALAQIMQLTDAQIQAFPPAQRQQILMLRQQLMGAAAQTTN